jgi:hypothetical protein
MGLFYGFRVCDAASTPASTLTSARSSARSSPRRGLRRLLPSSVCHEFKRKIENEKPSSGPRGDRREEGVGMWGGE